jgi:transposase
MTKLPKDTDKRIQELAEKGWSLRQIAEKLNISKATASRVCSKQLPLRKKSVGGRPQKLSPSDKRYCVRTVCRDPKATSKKVAKSLHAEFGINVTPQTVRRALREQGMGAVEKTKKPMLTRKQIKNRLTFAKAHQFWTKDDWRRVVYTDESKINRFNSDGRLWAWIRDSAELQPRQVKMNVKHGGGCIMVWGCILAHGPGYLCQIEGTMDQHVYKEILSTHLLQSLEYYRINPKKIILQQDNDPKHTAKSVQEWLADQPFKVLSWPSQSPDLNPIEHIWALVKRRLCEYESAPTGLLDLWERVEQVWDKLTKEDCLKVIDSMPDRIQAVLSAEGRWTDY